MGIGAPFLRAFHDKYIYSLVEKQTLPPRLDLFLSFFLLCPLTDPLSVLRQARVEPPLPQCSAQDSGVKLSPRVTSSVSSI